MVNLHDGVELSEIRRNNSKKYLSHEIDNIQSVPLFNLFDDSDERNQSLSSENYKQFKGNHNPSFKKQMSKSCIVKKSFAEIVQEMRN